MTDDERVAGIKQRREEGWTPTPEEGQWLVERFGSKAAAARAMGAGRETVRYWCMPLDDRRRRATHERRKYQLKRRDLERAYRARREAAGLCTSCGEYNDRAPKVRCTTCYFRYAERKRENQRIRKRLGMCAVCKRDVVPGKATCEYHRKYTQRKNKERYAKKRKANNRSRV